jgi:hypothetical protein
VTKFRVYSGTMKKEKKKAQSQKFGSTEGDVYPMSVTYKKAEKRRMMCIRYIILIVFLFLVIPKAYFLPTHYI